mmetsp:Transcript_13406/g.31168  ORF Transcript_13406/g.31168 Transcript_13406/m.31168 type:complete len:542 (+) Transcript_13406:86-1711(+)|eukprot:CAMPEP_0116839766 /NCGR_PEP_ID=MMETSP0418-20121206/9952_1 /TAXON_ID=1158023 /ORGANISM="Astrosyne radiata, Strain 13vi08-1A" /LENGTH=541 /DNA_ID=CAMNT_0004469919 /DNA_START=49 /DNA_END=1674 /DNA_ORIENTATION=+
MFYVWLIGLLAFRRVSTFQLKQAPTISPPCLVGHQRRPTRIFGSSTVSVELKDMVYGDDTKSAANKPKTKGGWFVWLLGGKPRGASEVKMREAEALGGLPRSDRYSSKDWLHNTISLPNSAILRAIRFPLWSMTAWAFFVSLVHRYLSIRDSPALKYLCIPTQPHSLMVSSLGLLLVFRTNSAYQRFVEGRQIWERIVNSSRDLFRMVMLYERELGIEKRKRIQRLCAAFPYLLRHRIRPNLVMHTKVDDDQQDPENTIRLYQDAAAIDNDVEAAVVANKEEASAGGGARRARPLYAVDKRTLPWRLLPADALELCARAQNRPLWVCDRMSREIKAVPDGANFSSRERLTMIGHVEKLSHCIGACERIHQTAVPLNYARHSLRSLTMWLLSLPFALVSQLGMLTSPVVFLVSWLMFGVYEIGYSIEDPFQGTLRLSILCDTVRQDVLGDEAIRSTAFEMDEERADADEGEKDDEEIRGGMLVYKGGQEGAIDVEKGIWKRAPFHSEAIEDEDDDDMLEGDVNVSLRPDSHSSIDRNSTAWR